MLDHIGLKVSSYDRSKAFFAVALEPLGYGLIEETHGHCGFGSPGVPRFWFSERLPGAAVAEPVHIGFVAASRAAVDAFYAAALKAGGVDNGRPGLREIYHPNYYGAFVLDPDGNNVEAVCHTDGHTDRHTG
jgi:catechol 2,3-dioxygenase-like lactoylglutathione lyase family enzyme